MSSLLTLDRLSLSAPDGRVLFSDLTLAIGRERVGLVGRNGSGKSTLLRAIAGDAHPTAGSIALGGRVGTFRQMSGDAAGSAADLLGVADALALLDRIEQGEGSTADLENADWLLPERIASALDEAGIGGADLARPLSTFSGGERMRLGLARLLLEAPDLMLLDEPTNNLDDAGREAVAALLARWRGAALVATHDRALLERVDRIVELSPVGVTVFSGGWSAFAGARAAARERAAEAVERASAAVRSGARAAQATRERQARRDAGGRAFAASGSAPRIALGLAKRRAEQSAGRSERMAEAAAGAAGAMLEQAQSAVERLTPLSIILPPTSLPSNRTVLRLEGVAFEAGGRRLFDPLDLAVVGPQRIALAGPNGSGKTSLMKLITGELAASSGSVLVTVPLAYLDQHVGLLADDSTLLDNLRRLQPHLTVNAAHAALARFAFRNRDALRLASGLSGGERLRAGLACVMSGAAPPQLLLLDEPTNHLDVESTEELENALRSFDGALIVVSHDTAFLVRIGVTMTVPLERPSATG